jgi:hypothetical protein
MNSSRSETRKDLLAAFVTQQALPAFRVLFPNLWARLRPACRLCPPRVAPVVVLGDKTAQWYFGIDAEAAGWIVADDMPSVCRHPRLPASPPRENVLALSSEIFASVVSSLGSQTAYRGRAGLRLPSRGILGVGGRHVAWGFFGLPAVMAGCRGALPLRQVVERQEPPVDRAHQCAGHSLVDLGHRQAAVAQRAVVFSKVRARVVE